MKQDGPKHRLERKQSGGEEASLAKRLGWMAMIWTASVAVLGLVSLILRYWLVG